MLKSWAVTRGPSYDPHEKRLAVRTEDHPLAYGGFEGVIPKGNYGGGTVMLWDRGSWTPDGDPHEGLKKGKLTFSLQGERLNGKWSLVRMRPQGHEKRENWLLVKNDDETADPARDVLKDHTVSVDTGRTLDQIAEKGRAVGEADFKDKPAPKRPKPKARAKAAKTTGLPTWRQPQLATLETSPPDGDGWLVEMKYDGYRVLIARDGGDVRLYTRNGHDWTDRWPNLAEAARQLDCRTCLLDGEAVAFDANGKPDFSTLQQAMTAGDPVSCFVFDCLSLDGEDLSAHPLTDRKARLATLVGKRTKPLLYSDHVEGHAEAVLARLCHDGHEGIVMKRADRPYRGGRSRDWLKVKCTRRQEFVIGGWQPSDKTARAFSSILLGAHRDGKLVYAGRVGTGFDAARMEDLAARFDKLARKTSPFASLPKEVKSARFVTPKLVAEVDYAELTADGAIRHGAFKGLREDKPAAEIVFETPAQQPLAPVPHETRDRIAGVKLSSPDKVLFKSQGTTKADLAAHYERVADRMLPHVGNRLLSLVRCPEGRAAACFFQKHPHKTLPDRFRTLDVTGSDGKSEPYVWIDALPGLIAGVQMGVLEWHIWGSRADRIERPDRLVFDLDPDEGLALPGRPRRRIRHPRPPRRPRPCDRPHGDRRQGRPRYRPPRAPPRLARGQDLRAQLRRKPPRARTAATSPS